MKLRAPSYYKNFKCIANMCKNNCCKAGWEIDIDNDTATVYKNISCNMNNKLNNNLSYDISNKLNKNISYDNTPHFILDKNGICPFLNKNNLCEIYIELGEKNLCQICKDHPRYYEWFNNVKECGIGLCCEEAARIILTDENTFSTYEVEIPTETCDSYDVELYTYLLNARAKIISYLERNDIPLKNRIQDVLWYAYTLQLNIDNNLLDDEEIINIKIDKKNNIKNILEYFLSLNFNSKKWPTFLKNNIKFCDIFFQKNDNNFNYFFNKNLKINNYLKNISIYFIWRYFLKGTFDGDILSKVKLMAISVAILYYLFYCEYKQSSNLTLENIIDIVRNYSEEIEYSEDNLQKLADDSYELNIFSTEKIMELFF